MTEYFPILSIGGTRLLAALASPLSLAALAGYWLWRNAPRGPMPALARVLFAGFAWLPVAMLLFSAQSL